MGSSVSNASSLNVRRSARSTPREIKIPFGSKCANDAIFSRVANGSGPWPRIRCTCAASSRSAMDRPGIRKKQRACPVPVANTLHTAMHHQRAQDQNEGEGLRVAHVTSVRHARPQIASWHMTSGTRSSYRECRQPPTTFSKGWKCTVFVMGHPQLMAAKCPA
jgi:hypothetical protein